MLFFMQVFLRVCLLTITAFFLSAVSHAANNWVTHIDVLIGSNTGGNISSLLPGGTTYDITSDSVNGNPQSISFEFDVDVSGMNLTHGLDAVISSGIPMNPAAQFWAWHLPSGTWVNVGSPASDPDFMRVHIDADVLPEFFDGNIVHFQAAGSTWGPPGGPPPFTIDIDYIIPWVRGMPNASVQYGGSASGLTSNLEEIDTNYVSVPAIQGGTLPSYAANTNPQWYAALRGHISVSAFDLSGGLVFSYFGHVAGTADDTYTIIAAKDVQTGQFERLNPTAFLSSMGQGAVSSYYLSPSLVPDYINTSNQIELVIFSYTTAFSGVGTPTFLFDHVGVAGAKGLNAPTGFGLSLPSWAESARYIDRVQSGGNGPSSADYVEASTGVFGHAPQPDIKAFNRESRPDVAYSRMYSTRLAFNDIQSPGLPAGWTHCYDYTMSTSVPGTWSPVVFRHPNGAEEVFTPELNLSGTPTGNFSDSGSVKPYILTGTPGPNAGEWTQLLLLHRDSSLWVFGTPLPPAPIQGGGEPMPGGGDSRKTANRKSESARPPVGGGTGGGGSNPPPPPPPPGPSTLRLRQIKSSAETPVDFLYDSQERLAHIQVLGNDLLTINYGGNGYLSYIRSWLSKEVRYSYATQGSDIYLSTVSTVVPVSQPTAPTRWAYDYGQFSGKPFLNEVSAPNAATGSGLASHPIVYDSATGKVDTFEDANGNERLYDYQASQTSITVKDAQGNTDAEWVELHNSLGLTTGVIDALGRQTTFAYSDLLNPYKVTYIQDRNGKNTVYEYDLIGNLKKVRERQGTGREIHTTYTYSYAANANGLLTRVQEGTNLSVPKTPTDFVYDSAGRITQVRTPIPGQSGTGLQQTSKQYLYTTKGNISQINVIGPSGSFLTYTFNYVNDGSFSQNEMKGRPLTITNPLGGVQHFRYFNDGTLSQSSSTLVDTGPEERKTAFGYDTSGRIASVTHPSKTNGAQPGSTDVLSYTPAGDLMEVEHLNEVGGLMRSVSASRGVEAEVVGAGGNAVPTELGKDAMYRSVTMENGNQQVTKAIYDAVGNLSKIESPLGNGDRVTLRDLEGNPTRMIRRSGAVIDITRAADDARILEVTANGADSVTYQYDIYNRITSIQDSSGTTTYNYDDLGNKVSVIFAYIGVPSQTVSYVYNPDGSRSRMYVPTGGTNWTKTYFDYAYFANGQLNYISPPWRAGSAIDYIWRQDGTIKQQRNSDLRTIINYNGRGQISTINNLSRSTTSNLLYSRFTLTYDDYGNLATNTALINAAGQAASVNSTTVYEYASNGKLSREWKDFVNANQVDYDYNYTPDASGYYVSARGTSYPRDAEGKLTTWQYLSGLTTSNDRYSGITYDNYGRTLEVRNAGNTLLLVNTWRGDGKRASRTAQNGTIYYIYDDNFVIAEVKPNGDVDNGYAYGLLGLTEEWDKSRNDESSISWDPHGNPVSRHRGLTPYDINVYDVWGRMYSDVLSSNGTAAPQLDSVGGGSQWGPLRDQQTFTGMAALGMSRSKYFDPVSGRNLTYEDRFGNFYTDDEGASDTLYWFEAAKYIPLVGAGVYGMEAAYEFQNGNNAEGWWNVAGAAVEIIPFGVEAAKVTKLSRAAKFRQTGGTNGYLDPWSEKGFQKAEQQYDEIRKLTTDVDEIAAHTGFKRENIQKVKNHIFMEEHMLTDFVRGGYESRRFDASLCIAESWSRLRSGLHTVDDIKMLKHEAAESWHMKRHGSVYRVAHEAAEKRFPYPFEI